MANLELYRQMYADNVATLYGGPKRSVLINVPTQLSKGGDSVGVDGVTGNAAQVSDTRSLKNRKTFEDIVSPQLSAFMEIQTPHTGTTKQRSFVSCKTIEATDTIGAKEDLLQVIDIKSPVMEALVEQVYIQEDVIVLDALGNDVLREDAAGNKTTVSLPASQEYETENSGYIGIDDLFEVKGKFGANYVHDELYLVVNPIDAAKMKKNSKDYFFSADFVSTMGAIDNGEVTKVAGFTIIECPSVTVGSFYSFAKKGVTVNNWSGVESKIDELPTQRYDTQLYISRDVNAVRNDDKAVVVGSIKA